MSVYYTLHLVSQCLTVKRAAWQKRLEQPRIATVEWMEERDLFCTLTCHGRLHVTHEQTSDVGLRYAVHRSDFRFFFTARHSTHCTAVNWCVRPID